jgi:hypothetical protein
MLVSELVSHCLILSKDGSVSLFFIFGVPRFHACHLVAVLLSDLKYPYPYSWVSSQKKF